MLKYNDYIVESLSKNKTTEDPIINAAKRGSANKIKELIKKGSNKDAKDNVYGFTALMYAVLNKYLSAVIELINCGANPNIQDPEGRTVLMMVSTQKIVDKLLDAGADVNIQNNRGETAIMMYVNQGKSDMLEYLMKFLDKGLDLEIKDKNGINFYDRIKNLGPIPTPAGSKNWIEKVEDYMDDNFPQFKDEWDLKQNISKYNL